MKYLAPSAAYPGAYRYPLRLSIIETANPQKVFTELFSRYDLPSIRAFLRKCQTDHSPDDKGAVMDHTAKGEGVPSDRIMAETNGVGMMGANGVSDDPPGRAPASGDVLIKPVVMPDDLKETSTDRFTTAVPADAAIYEDVEKLVEAAWRIHITGKEGGEEALTEEDFDDNEISFRKPLSSNILEQIRGMELVEALWEAFFFGLDDLIDTLEELLQAAMSNKEGIYEDASERARLVAFYRSLIPLVEALHIIKEAGRPTDWAPGETKHNRELALYDRTRHLTGKQVADPESVILDFFQKFTMTYIRRELWDWLNAVVAYDKEPSCVTRGDLLFFYQCVLGLLEFGYALYRNSMSEQKKTAEC